MQSRKKRMGISSGMEENPKLDPMIECANRLLDLYPDPIRFHEFLLDCYHWLVLHPKSTLDNDLPNVIFLNTEMIRHLVIPRMKASNPNNDCEILADEFKKLYTETSPQSFNDYLNSLYFSLQNEADYCARSYKYQTELTNGVYMIGVISSMYLLQEEFEIK